jgi:DNA-binding transcriptional MerR regulator
MDGYPTVEVARITGVNRKTLHFWDRSGLIGPSLATAKGSGTRRLYSFQDIVAVWIIHKLRLSGISLQGIRQVVQVLRNRSQSEQPLSGVFLVTDGNDVYESRGEAALVSLLRQKRQGFFCFVLDLDAVTAEVRKVAGSMSAA